MAIFKRSSPLSKKYPLVTWKDTEILRTVCKEVKKINKETINFAHDLQELMREYEWVGLAAPQIGINKRMAAITQWDTSKTDKQGRADWELLDEFVLINPRVLSTSSETSTDQEACLSLPGIKGDVSRPESITIEYEGIDWKKHIHKASWFNARVILHEMDHLDGVLFIDKLA